jgi:hypothetical protein
MVNIKLYETIKLIHILSEGQKSLGELSNELQAPDILVRELVDNARVMGAFIGDEISQDDGIQRFSLRNWNAIQEVVELMVSSFTNVLLLKIQYDDNPKNLLQKLTIKSDENNE